jgi:hypothetical protein
MSESECPPPSKRAKNKEIPATCNSDFARKNEENERKKNEDNESEFEEIKRMYEEMKRENEKFRLTSCSAILDLKEIKLRCTGSESSHIKGKHEKASVHRTIHYSSSYTENYTDMDVKQMLLKTTCPSRLLGILIDPENHDTQKELKYGTEADVVAYVVDALVDAITIAKALKVLNSNEKENELHFSRERSLFSGRPDILVIRTAKGIPLIVVEVKKPIVSQQGKPKTLSSEENVLGQVYDYARSLRAHGHLNPAVVLTSFEESFVCYSTDTEEATDEHDHNHDTITTSSSASASVSIASPLTGIAPHQSSTEASPSPPSLAPVVSMENEPHIFAPNYARKLNISQNFKSHELVGLFCSLLKDIDPRYFEPSMIQHVNRGTTYKFSNVLLFTTDKEKSYTWGSLGVNIGSPIVSEKFNTKTPTRKGKIQPMKNDENAYYLIGKLGYGDTSNVWHALNSSGEQVAIKLYVKNIDDEDNALSEKDFEDMAQAATMKEAILLKTIYPFLKEKVQNLVLNGFICVVMPLFLPVESCKRAGALDEVKDVLCNRFAKERIRYRNEDVRWRHVGIYHDHESGKDHTILYDLADLEEVRGDPSDNAFFVHKHIERLTERIDSEKKPTSTLSAAVRLSDD